LVVKKKKKSLLERFWDAMDSMKFAVVMLIVLAVVSLVGVILPQFPPEGFAGTLETLFIQKYGKFFGGIFVFLGLDHLFIAWWYYLLLALLCFNITVCSLNRLKRILALVRREHYLEKEQNYRDQTNHRSLDVELLPAEAARRVIRQLARDGYRVFNRQPDSEQAHLIYAKKGVISQFGPFFSHLSMVIIIVGAAISHLLSFQHFQWMGPNEQIEVPDLSYMSSPAYQLELVTGRMLEAFGLERKSSDLMLADSVIRHSDWRRLPSNLNFEKSFGLRLDKFEALFTPQGKPKAYLSTVTVLGPEAGAEPMFSQVIKVNDPLIYKGVYFYQNSYSPSGTAADWIELTVADKAGQERHNLKLGVNAPPVPLGDSGDSIRIVRFTGTFRLNRNGEVLDLPGEDRNPAVQVVVSRNGDEIIRNWAFKNFPDFSHRQEGPYSIGLVDYEKSFITGLAVRNHRSQMIIWTGFALLVVGIMLSFYVNYRQMWVMVAPGSGEGKSRIHLAGMSYKWKQPFLHEFKRFSEKVKVSAAGSSAAVHR